MWERMFEALTTDRDNQYLTIDSNIVRDRSQAATGKGGREDQVLGRSRGGLKTKIHMPADTFGRPLRILSRRGMSVPPGRFSPMKRYASTDLRDRIAEGGHSNTIERSGSHPTSTSTSIATGSNSASVAPRIIAGSRAALIDLPRQWSRPSCRARFGRSGVGPSKGQGFSPVTEPRSPRATGPSAIHHR